jgi:hypothetical protein
MNQEATHMQTQNLPLIAIDAFQIIDHGYEEPDYFGGCGVAFTPFTFVVTGVGRNAKEAYEGAIEELAQAEWDVSALPTRPRGIRRSDAVPAHNLDSLWHVSIRVRETVAGQAVRIERANRRFEGLGPAERQTAIARDVIAQIEADRYKVTPGTYMIFLQGPGLDEDSGWGNNHDYDVCETPVEFARDPEMRCKVCARGAMFMSGLKLFNHFDKTLRNRIPEAQESEFTIFEDSRLIECAFEGWSVKYAEMQYQRDRAGSLDFYPPELESHILKYKGMHPDPEDRLIVLMENIIRNDGRFLPGVGEG